MLKLLTALFSFIDRIGQYLAQRQLVNAGKAEQQVQVQRETEANVKKATDAVTVRDDARTERLRKRFDQATGNE